MREGNMQVRRIFFLFFMIVSVSSIFPAWGSDISLDDIKRWEKEEVVEPLIAAIRYWGSDVRAAAADVLGKIDPDWPRSEAAIKQVPEFIEALRNWNSDVRAAAVDALVKIDPNWPKSEAAIKQVPEFIEALRNWNSDVRVAAANALGQIGGARAEQPSRLQSCW